jgi:hypothetical protein
MKSLFVISLAIVSVFSFAKIPVAETPFSEYQFPSSQCRIIEHQQSRIFVPAYCFYQDGQVYNGEVTLQYREFLDQLDIIINQVPMGYASAGEQHTLESGGMFELFAYSTDGKPLTFAPEKKIVVQLATRFPDTKGLETFYLNRNTGNWEKQTSFQANPVSNNAIPNNNDSLWEDANWNYNYYIEGDLGFMTQATTSGVNVEEIRDRSFKTLQVDQMGIYNCDRVLDEETVPVLASFMIEQSKSPVTNYVYVVYKNKNSLFYYYPDKEITLKLLPDEPVAMFIFGNDGTIASVDPLFLDSFDVSAHANKKVVFNMKKLSKKPLDKSELAALTGL